jgi:TetR/AcrR family transcriptional regulator, transcriptional repressor for nem operon
VIQQGPQRLIYTNQSVYKLTTHTNWSVLRQEAAVTERGSARDKLLDAATSVIRAKGYAATAVDDLCAAAGVTKGAFFHHFKSKDDLAVAVADHWSETTGRFFAAAPYHAHADPLDRVLGYIDFRKALIAGPLPEFTCLIGTMVQETYDSHPAIRDACARSIAGHTGAIEADIRAAIEAYRLKPPWSAASLAQYTQAVLQGAFILAKGQGSPQVAVDCIDHLRRTIELTFNRRQRKEKAL